MIKKKESRLGLGFYEIKKKLNNKKLKKFLKRDK